MRHVFVWAAVWLSASAYATAPAPVPVVVGEEADLDACMAVVALKRAQTVQQGPGRQYASVASLPAGRKVYSCSSQGEWAGIVFDARLPLSRCGVSRAVPKPTAYRGPCQSGWVALSALEE